MNNCFNSSRFKLRASVAALPEADSPTPGLGNLPGGVRISLRPTCVPGPFLRVTTLPPAGVGSPQPLGAARRLLRDVLAACLDVPAVMARLVNMDGFDTQVLGYFLMSSEI